MGKENQIAEIAKIERLEAENANLTVENEVLQSEKENLMRTLEEGREEIESARKETAQEIYEKLIREIDELEQFYKAVAPKVAYAEINLVTTRAARKIVKRVLCRYGATEEFEPNVITLRLGIGKRDMDIMINALREYAENHPKYYADDANDLAHLIEYQRSKIEE